MKATYWFAIHLVLGLWLIVSPYALDFVDNQHAYWNAIASGVIALVVALAGMYSEREEAGHPSSSFKKTSSAA